MDHMATVIIKIVKEATAIPISSDNVAHSPCSIDADLFANNFCYNQFFSQISSSLFAPSMFELTCSFFDQVMGRYKTENHDYQGSRFSFITFF